MTSRPVSCTSMERVPMVFSDYASVSVELSLIRHWGRDVRSRRGGYWMIEGFPGMTFSTA